jgi:hypothetical protein
VLIRGHGCRFFRLDLCCCLTEHVGSFNDGTYSSLGYYLKDPCFGEHRYMSIQRSYGHIVNLARQLIHRERTVA